LLHEERAHAEALLRGGGSPRSVHQRRVLRQYAVQPPGGGWSRCMHLRAASFPAMGNSGGPRGVLRLVRLLPPLRGLATCLRAVARSQFAARGGTWRPFRKRRLWATEADDPRRRRADDSPGGGYASRGKTLDHGCP